MATNTGVWHKTTLQTAVEQPKTYHTTTVAGHKRSHDGSESHGDRTVQFTKSSLLPRQPPRLVASTIRPAGRQTDDGRTAYSQAKGGQPAPTSTNNPLLSLSHPSYALPTQLVGNLAAMGIESIYPWQKQCLLKPGLLQGAKNLVYSAPTGGGKSLIADILMLKHVVEDRDAKALLVLPYVALVQEKVRWLRSLAQGISRDAINGHSSDHGPQLWRRRADADSVRVVAFFGGGKIRATWQDFDIGVCTIEKANALINTAIDDCSILSLKAIVLDELHMIDDGYRGYVLELMATKLLCLDHRIQIIGMSATLTNIPLLAKWLGAHSYETQYRPVHIEEHLVVDGKVYPAEATSVLSRTASQPKCDSQCHKEVARKIEASSHKELKDMVLNSVVALANETARSGYGVLVFSGSRAACESDALLISRVMPLAAELNQTVLDRRMDLLGDLRSLSTGLDKALEHSIPSGVGFHHAGLTTEERDLIANAYDSGVIKVCVATCSLAAGINLPARRVILHNARMGRDMVAPSLLRQMRGRAGRKGKDDVGETYLCCRPTDLGDVVGLMHAELPEVSSCLITDQRRIRRALLEAISVRLATSRESLDEYVRNTLLFHSSEFATILSNVESSLEDLQAMGFVNIDEFSNYRATQLGKAIVASALDPEDGIFVHKELQRALKAFVMDGEMHILYTFTPVQDFSVTINWKVFWNEMENLDESGLRVLGFLGLKPTTVNKMLHGGKLKEDTAEEKEIARIYHRFYLALQLRDLCNEIPVHRVAQKYDMPRGTVQTLAQTCQGFAAGMIKFCELMGWGVMSAALDHFTDRLRAGAKSDLLELAKITFVKSRTARVFWENGFKTVASIANADPAELLPVLLQAQPNKVRLEQRDETKYKEKLLAKAKVIADSANRLWQIQMRDEIDEE